MRAPVNAPRRPVVAQLVNCLGLGGTERQLVEQLRVMSGGPLEADVSCLQKVGDFLGDVRALGHEPEEFHLRGSLARPNTALQIIRLAQRLRARKAVLLHCHDFYSNLVGVAAARLTGIPAIVSRRDLGAWIGPGRAGVLRIATRSAARVLCNASAIQDRLVDSESVPRQRITVIPNLLDTVRFDTLATQTPDAGLPSFERQTVIAMVGNMKHAIKGHAVLLLAAAAVVRAAPSVRFLLIGDGELRAQLERRAADLGIAHAVVFAGRRTDVPALLARADIAVCTSLSEGLSNAIMESMAARLPVVATGVGGNLELVRDGRTGFIVAPGDSGLVAQRLIDLVHQPHLARRMGLAGRAFIEREFSPARFAERLQALYASFLGREAGHLRAA